MLEALAAVLMIAGGILTMLAGIGVWRLPGTRMRMHAAAKGGGAAFALILAAWVCHRPEWGTAAKAIVTLVCCLLTLPLSAQMLGRYVGQSEAKTTENSEQP